LDIDFLKYQLRGNPKHLSREDIDRLAKDGPRYKALGNSMAVPVMRWIGERIDAVSRIAAIPKREVA
jgi:site-specific DNA-cytosine methylase